MLNVFNYNGKFSGLKNALGCANITFNPDESGNWFWAWMTVNNTNMRLVVHIDVIQKIKTDNPDIALKCSHQVSQKGEPYVQCIVIIPQTAKGAIIM